MELNVFAAQSGIMLLVQVALIAVKAFALVTAITFSAEAYTAADKLTKPAWVAILGIALVMELIGFVLILNLILTVATFVYLADVRPALRGLRRS